MPRKEITTLGSWLDGDSPPSMCEFRGIFLDMQDSLRLTLRAKMALMSCTETLKAHVSSEIKLRAKAIAEREFLSEAAWLKRLVLREIRACDEVRQRRARTTSGRDRTSPERCRGGSARLRQAHPRAPAETRTGC